jgi:hypothetical protein
MPDQLKLQNEPVTQEMFDHLPALLGAYQVKLITAWNDSDLAAAVKAGTIKTYKPCKPRKGYKRRYRKYLKNSVARVVGFNV